jgi:hypothetical protein
VNSIHSQEDVVSPYEPTVVKGLGRAFAVGAALAAAAWRAGPPHDDRVHGRSNPNSQPSGIVTGPDGNLWFTEQAFPGRIGRITPGLGVATGVRGGGIHDGFGMERVSA